MIRQIVTVLFACLGLGIALPVVAESPPEVADQFDCATCHTERLREFRRRGAVTLVEHEPRPDLDTGRQDAASTPDMCLSCHDGFVLDSRSLWKQGHEGHPVGMLPSARVQSPVSGDEPVFPMNDDGRMYCGTCHSPHNHPDATSASPPFMRVNLEDGNLCLACHSDKKSIAESDHAPPSSRRRSTAADYTGRGICSRCHLAHDARGPVMWAREPGSGSLTANALCLSCHEGDVTIFEHTESITAWSDSLRSGLVADMHASMPVFDQDGSRALTGVIGCPTCHDAHRQRAKGLRQERPGLFLRRTRTEHSLCVDCHGPSSLRRYLYFHSGVSRRR
jgi:predicted CXXCH cytochrome family protein